LNLASDKAVMTTLQNIAHIVFCAAAGLAGAVASAAEDGAMGGALDAQVRTARAKPNPAYNRPPLTVEVRARLTDAAGYNILVANEPKASATHWEIFTMPSTGHATIYMPGNHPDHVRSSTAIADGRWHWVAMVIDGKRVRLFVDGREAGSAEFTRPADAPAQAGPLAFGVLAEGGIGCHGMIDEVRISRVARTIDQAPAGPLEADAETVGLWHFDQKDRAPDASALKNDAVITPADGLAPLERPAEGQVGVIAPPCDLPATRDALKAALGELSLATVGSPANYRDGLLVDWDEQHWHWTNQLAGRQKLPGPPEQALDRQALAWPQDGDALGTLLRRTAALLADLARAPAAGDLAAEGRDLAALVAAAGRVPVSQAQHRKAYFLAACALNRRIALRNPLLDFDRVLFVARGVYKGSRKNGLQPTGDNWGQHFQTQYFAFNAIPGGGLFAVKDFKTSPVIVPIVKDSVVCNGRFKGQKLEGGAYLSPDLDFDGRTILFSWTQNTRHDWAWTPQTTWKVFRVGADGSDLTQLTDGAWNDFDACWLPSGRIAFLSERRGGFIRCFGGLAVPQHSLHGMKADGTDLRPLSYFETGEFNPSVNNDGMIVYTRWDYVDRENCEGSNFWICGPDGSNPRAPHGNYPYPWHTYPGADMRDSRTGRPYTELGIRAIPGSTRYIFTAAPHHGEAFGSLCMLDLDGPDDGAMSQIKRITPYVPFPESEMSDRRQYPYGTAWPLSESYYLCNEWENLYLLDRFGNQVLLCENSLVFGGRTDWDMRLVAPIPLRPRVRPPVVPDRGGEAADAKGDRPPARTTLVNVYDTDQPFPPGTRIKYLRVVQDVLKTNPEMNQPVNMGYHWENTPRIPLGIVPVEEDGSASFQAPVERELIFQALDANYMAVQSMRSVAYVHRGEQLTCQGCHEPTHRPPARPAGVPLALRREPSQLRGEAGPVEPITYYRMVKPVFDKTCQPCHIKERKGPQDMSFAKLEPYVFYFSGGMRGSVTIPIHGGTRSIPGRVGARASRMGLAMLKEPHKGHVSPEDYRRVVLWLDCNSMRLGAFHDEDKQMAGQLVWPLLDVDPANPLGLERPPAVADHPVVKAAR
jgi:hypothetical protein